MSETAAIVLAAGKSTRMRSDLPKVLHEVCGRPMLSYVIGAATLAGVDRLIIVVGHGRDAVRRAIGEDGNIAWVEQKEQRGTGHAVLCCREALEGVEGSILVVAGDMPLVRRESLAALLEARNLGGDALVMATTFLDNPGGYGRIVRDADGRLEAVVEHADCTAEQREIREVNPSYYCFDGRRLFGTLEQLEPAGGSGEYYLTDMVRALREAGHEVSAGVQVPAEDAQGINSRLDLAMVNRVMQDRIQIALMNEGVTIVDPDNTWIESNVSVGAETVIHPFTMISTGASIGGSCRVGPFARVGKGEVLADGSTVGPVTGHGATT